MFGDFTMIAVPWDPQGLLELLARSQREVFVGSKENYGTERQGRFRQDISTTRVFRGNEKEGKGQTMPRGRPPTIG
jgi:hypothetical protein